MCARQAKPHLLNKFCAFGDLILKTWRGFTDIMNTRKPRHECGSGQVVAINAIRNLPFNRI